MSSEMLDVSRWQSSKPADETRDFCMQQTMIRVKDPAKSLDFYVDVLGMTLIWHSHFPQWGFSVYFCGYVDPSTLPKDEAGLRHICMTTPGCVELTHNHGSENESDGPVYNTGNADTTGTADGKAVKGGFGHIGITVPDVYATCERFKSLGVDFKKSPNSGGMKGLAFVKDPDGYLIEILSNAKEGYPGFPTKQVDCLGVSLSDGGGYTDNSKSS